MLQYSGKVQTFHTSVSALLCLQLLVIAAFPYVTWKEREPSCVIRYFCALIEFRNLYNIGFERHVRVKCVYMRQRTTVIFL